MRHANNYFYHHTWERLQSYRCNHSIQRYKLSECLFWHLPVEAALTVKNSHNGCGHHEIHRCLLKDIAKCYCLSFRAMLETMGKWLEF